MTIIIQPGSYNPLHHGHTRICNAVKEAYPEVNHWYILASKTCDKGIIPLQELKRRGEAIKAQYGHYRVVESGLFIDIIRLFKEEGYDKIILAVGEDTIYRFFKDWDKFYEDKGGERITRYMDYLEHFRNVLWYVTERECPERALYSELLMKYMKSYGNIVWSGLPMDDISSTKIREGLINNEL